jgi:hypothetical protein
MNKYARSVPVLKIYGYMPTLSGKGQNKSGEYVAEPLIGKNCLLRACLGNNYQKYGKS